MSRLKQLKHYYDRLDDANRRSLLDFAEFLTVRQADQADQTPGAAAPMPDMPAPEPEIEPRPEKESVVAAMKRLSRVYHMINKDEVLNVASGLMAQHIMQGRDSVDVIDELEALFIEAFEKQYR